jgi:hypothetical protein
MTCSGACCVLGLGGEVGEGGRDFARPKPLQIQTSYGCQVVACGLCVAGLLSMLMIYL